ncbi:hypothetical protein [Frondihabitans australicus]|uniref:Transcriptional regulator, AbiEi antitoxin, Type IV TA system n=1 Tax=Frondihabitans australicus TaxID=386892 RepID=A0A495IGW0_9MICO|nr:hypothetical protein [Frondihabitans australicus]RKR74551.1 hypothetical protein C8E83_1670 [Frondihabitans australicus]
MREPSVEPHPSLLVRSSLDDTLVRRACLRGDLIRLVAGRYVRREHWEAFDAAARHVMFVLAAVSCLRVPVVVSHASAAAFWGLPRLGAWPARAHVIDPSVQTGSTGRFVSRHAGRLDETEVAERFGVMVTGPARTAADVALSEPRRQAVVALDHSLRDGVTTRDEIAACLERRSNGHGVKKGLTALDFADPLANRPGESLSRVVMAESHLARPTLQRTFVNPHGRDADVDFFWESRGIVGEFDGETKYRDSERWSGLPAEEVVIREKQREDWLRSLPEVRGFVRWTWRDAYARGRLARILLDVGVPLESGRLHASRAN